MSDFTDMYAIEIVGKLFKEKKIENTSFQYWKEHFAKENTVKYNNIDLYDEWDLLTLCRDIIKYIIDHSIMTENEIYDFMYEEKMLWDDEDDIEYEYD